MEHCKIALVDDKIYNTQILSDKLLTRPGVEITDISFGGLEFLKKLNDNAFSADLVFMDIDMPDLDGIETVKQAKAKFPEIHFVMITVFDDMERVFAAIRAGASGYLLKDESITGLHKAIDDVLIYGGAPMSPSIARKAFTFLQNAEGEDKVTEKSPLSAREMDILNALAKGKSYTVIAEELFISPHTVRKHMTNIYEELHVNSKVEAVRMALGNKWV